MQIKASYLYRNTTSKEKRAARLRTKETAESKVKALIKAGKLPQSVDWKLTGWSAVELTVIFIMEKDAQVSAIVKECESGNHVMEYVRDFSNSESGKPTVELYFAY